MDPKQIVAQGYDKIAEQHHWWAGHTRAEERQRYTDFLLEQVPAGGSVLELGCGVGLPTARILAQRFQVTGSIFHRGILRLPGRMCLMLPFCKPI